MTQEILDRIGITQGTDKSSLRWDYLRHYEELFQEWRHSEFNLIEIGVGGGHSLFAWRQFFTRARIVGIDIDEHARRCSGERIDIEIGSQADGKFLTAICDKYPPSIIVDDGSHQADHIMASFQTLFPRLAPGGWYVIEDLNITGSQDKVALTPHAFFSNTVYAMLNRLPDNHSDPASLDQIDRIDCAAGIAFLRKKDPEARRRRLMDGIDIVGQTRNPNNHLWLAERLMEDEMCPEQAELSARRATELHPTAGFYHLGLSRVLQRRGNMIAAIEAAQKAIELNRDDFEGYFQLALVRLGTGDLAQAHVEFTRSLEIAPSYLRVHIENRRDRVLSQRK